MTTDRNPKTDCLRSFVCMAMLALATAVLLAGAGYYPTRAAGGAAGVEGMFIGIGVALLGAWIGSMMPFFFIRPDPRPFLNGLLLGLVARFGVTLGLALVLRVLEVVPAKPLLLWAGIGQVVILVPDTVGLLRLVRRLKWEGER